METLETTGETQPLAQFCAEVLVRHKEHWPPTEDTLAREFVEAYSPGSFINVERMVEFSARLGIETSLEAMPEELRGLNCSTEERTVILLGATEPVPGSREHTFFHELREVMERHFGELGFSTAKGEELEKRAERFAISVRTQDLTHGLFLLTKELDTVQECWKRWLGYTFVFIMILAVGLSYTLLPYLEDHYPAANRRR